MKKQRSDARETRRRVLAAASQVFAQKGFWGATNADICSLAGVNTAAVNYHFTSKENLYVEAWKHAFERSNEAHPADGGLSSDKPAEERLRARVRSFIHKFADPNTVDLEIIHKEMVNPTGLLAETIAQAVRPLDEALQANIRDLLGPEAGDKPVLLCFMSIMSQSLGIMHHIDPNDRLPGPKWRDAALKELTMDEIADHIIRFSLAGINAVREAGAHDPEPAGRNQTESLGGEEKDLA